MAPMEPVSNLGSPIQTASDAPEPVSPEVSEPQTSEIASDSLSDIEQMAAAIPDSVPDSPHLPIDLKTSNVDASDYETDQQFDEESIDIDEDEDIEFDEDDADNMR